jgi:hypothetical protein
MRMALSEPHVMSDLSPECAPEQTCVDHSEFMGSRHPLIGNAGSVNAGSEELQDEVEKFLDGVRAA